MVCDSNGDWKDSSDLVCQANSCDIDDIANAVAYADYSSCHGKTSGEVCTPVCSPGTDQITNVSQPIHLVCDADGDFAHDVALTGAAVANVARLNASLSNVTDPAAGAIVDASTFETGFDGWTTPLNGLPFTRDASGTPTGSTGPSSGFGGSSYYMYAEASAPNYPYKTFDTQKSFPTELYAVAFQYHMYGSHMGSAVLETSVDGASWVSVWSQSGNKGNQWNHASANLGSGTKMLRFTYTSGTGDRGDFALDNIRGIAPASDSMSLVLHDAMFDLDASTAVSPNVVDRVGGMVFSSYPVSTGSDGVSFWDLDNWYLTRTGGATLKEGQAYTHAYVLKWRVGDTGERTLLRHSDDHCTMVPNNARDLGMYSNRAGGWRDSGYNIDPQQSWWDVLVVTGQGGSSNTPYGTSVFYTKDGPTGPLVERGTVDRVCSGRNYYRLGWPNDGPGLISRVMSWPRVLNQGEIQRLSGLTADSGKRSRVSSSLDLPPTFLPERVSVPVEPRSRAHPSRHSLQAALSPDLPSHEQGIRITRRSYP